MEDVQKHGWELLGGVRDLIWSSQGGILQADNEGFSNEEGFHILWQFDEQVSGERNMAILNEQAEWQKFKMDLGNSVRRDFKFASRIYIQVKHKRGKD